MDAPLADGGTSAPPPLPRRAENFANPIRGTSPDEDHLFSDLACLGLDASADPTNNTLLPMPADPSSAEQFSFAFSGLGRDAYLAFDAPDRAGALRALLLDRSRQISYLYDTTVQAVYQLYKYRSEHKLDAPTGTCDSLTDTDDCKEFVRLFAQLDNSGLSCLDSDSCSNVGEVMLVPEGLHGSSLMLPEKTLHSAAAEKLRTLIDSPELVGFAETGLVEVLSDDVSSLYHRLKGHDSSVPLRLNYRELSCLNVVATEA